MSTSGRKRTCRVTANDPRRTFVTLSPQDEETDVVGALISGLIGMWLLFVLVRGFRSGVIPFTHDPRLATRRATSPIQFWVHSTVLFASAILMFWYALHLLKGN